MKTALSKIWKVISKQKAVLAIVALLLLMLMPQTRAMFYSSSNWMEMLRSAAILEIVAFGVTVAVICGGCDLSVGGTLCLGGIVTVLLARLDNHAHKRSRH